MTVRKKQAILGCNKNKLQVKLPEQKLTKNPNNLTQLPNSSVSDKQPSIKLGFELWEVLTAFTVALTLASGLIWFSNLQPKNNQEAFLLQTKSKAAVYTNWQQTKFERSQIPAFYTTADVTGPCLESILTKSIPTKNYDSRQNNWQQRLKNEEKNRDSLAKENAWLTSNPDYQSVQSSFVETLQAQIDYDRESYKLATGLLETQQLLAKKCQEGYTFTNPEISTLEEFKENLASINQAKAGQLLENLSFILDSITENSNSLENPSDSNFKVLKPDVSLETMNGIVLKIIGFSYQDLSSLDSLLDKEQKLIEVLQEYETWEKSFITGNEYLQARTILIYEN